MGKQLLNAVLIFSIFTVYGCEEKESSKGNECNPFCKGEQWKVEEFSLNPYPAVVPFEKNKLVSALEDGLNIWESLGNDRITVFNSDRSKKVVFSSQVNIDTLNFTTDQSTIKMVMEKESEKNIHLKMIGLFKGEIELKKLID